ncbi:ATP/GTP-binding protein [Verrucomicrobiota bacterium]
MLIEFKVENFRSFRESQTLSLISSNYEKSLPGNVIDRQLPGLASARYLRGAAVYGGNASGKSNLLEAIQFMAGFVRNSATRLKPEDKTGAQPFLLDQDSRTRPSRFEVTFVISGVRYQYGFALTDERVTDEFLVAYPNGLAQRWFDRTYDQEDQTYVWSNSAAHFRLDKALRDKTRANGLFLSVGPQFNNEQLAAVYNWFAQELRFLNLGGDAGLSPVYTASVVEKSGEGLPRIMRLLQSADFGVTGAAAERKEIPMKQFTPEVLPQLDLAQFDKDGQTVSFYDVKVQHHAAGMPDQDLDFAQESAGTRRLFALAGPWIDILESGYTVFVDELETSLHPILVRAFLQLLFCEQNNPNGAQVIFTTHNPILLDNTLLRRDQVWFTEKGKDGATHLYPLTDYKPRKGESLAKGYLSGRYGAIPFLPEGLKL